jgi:hypothetical protein
MFSVLLFVCVVSTVLTVVLALISRFTGAKDTLSSSDAEIENDFELERRWKNRRGFREDRDIDNSNVGNIRSLKKREEAPVMLAINRNHDNRVGVGRRPARGTAPL